MSEKEEKGKVLVSWIAVQNDPYERNSKDTSDYRLVDGQKVPGPTLTLLLDKDSDYKDKISDVVLFVQTGGAAQSRAQRARKETIEELKQRVPRVKVYEVEWDGDDPTDHDTLFEFLKKKMPEIRKRYGNQELVIHISPGTPTMQTLWVLMTAAGFVDGPAVLVKSVRKDDRGNGAPVTAVNIKFDTFHTKYIEYQKHSQPPPPGEIRVDVSKLRSTTMKALYENAQRFARINVPILILGERGSGKTQLAEWIRFNSPFRDQEKDKNWAKVPCGQYDENLMRSELFGYTKGAFTGADKDKSGLLKIADKDTLFLDEIGDISKSLQRLLIRAVEEKEFQPVGSTTFIHSDFRLLTATNLSDSDLKERVDPDFLDRISPVVLRVPSLRNIPEEFEWMWEDVWKQCAARAGLRPDQAQKLSRSHHQKIVKHMEQNRNLLRGNLRDLYRVGYHIAAGLADPNNTMNTDDIIDFGTQTLTDSFYQKTRPIELQSQRIAQAFADSASLDGLCEWPLSTKALDTDIHRYIAEQVRQFAKQSAKKAEDLVDVSDRTLREWVK